MPTKRLIDFQINLLNNKGLKKGEKIIGGCHIIEVCLMAIDVSKMACFYVLLDVNLRIVKLSKIK